MADMTKEIEITRHLNRLGAFGVSDLAHNDALREVITDYFNDRDAEEVYSESEEGEGEEDTTPVPGSRSADRPKVKAKGAVPLLEPMLEEEEEENLDSDVEEYNPSVFPADDALPPEDEMKIFHERQPACTCKLFDGKPCYQRFDMKRLTDRRLQALELQQSKREFDVSVMSQLSCCMFLSEKTRRLKKSNTERRRKRCEYTFLGYRVCYRTFMYLNAIGDKDTLTRLSNQLRESGIVPRVHKLKKVRPHNALAYSEIRRVVDFIVNYAEVHAISLPGRTPYHKSDVKLLPTNCTKRSVYTAYKEVADASDIRVVALRTFRHIWQDLVPYIVTMKPATDLCWMCQQRSATIARFGNIDDDKKFSASHALTEHLLCASKERSLYNAVCKEAKDSLGPNVKLGGKNDPCSYDGKCHYSFDFAQQMQYPSDPLQPGPIYFKSPRKCALFGVCCEALPCQINYLIDEAVDVGKGANCVVSLIHHFFENFGLGEKEVHLHADNCSGQNKNSCMMMYLMWRVLTGRHEKITLSFLITGHTKFSCDWCFGLVKRLYRRTPVICLADLCRVVNESSEGNIAQLCGNEKGVGSDGKDVDVKTFDWTNFLAQYFRKVKDIKKYHHFSFEEGSGVMKVKEFSDSNEETQELLKADRPASEDLPDRIYPHGLDLKRQWYLHDEIREFIISRDQRITEQQLDEVRNLVAPMPQAPKPVKTSVASTSIEETGQDTDIGDDEPPPKKGRGKGQAKGKGKGKGKGRGKSISK